MSGEPISTTFFVVDGLVGVNFVVVHGGASNFRIEVLVVDRPPWWAQPVEFTHGGPYEAYDISTPRNVRTIKERDPAWGSYNVMSGQYLTMRIWTKANLRLPQHYAKHELCMGFDETKDCRRDLQ